MREAREVTIEQEEQEGNGEGDGEEEEGGSVGSVRKRRRRNALHRIDIRIQLFFFFFFCLFFLRVLIWFILNYSRRYVSGTTIWSAEQPSTSISYAMKGPAADGFCLSSRTPHFY